MTVPIWLWVDLHRSRNWPWLHNVSTSGSLAKGEDYLVISGKRANAVLVSEEDWSAIQETLYLLATPGMRESIKDAMSEPIAKSKKALKL
jgi:hypothetical protein